jgi:hypothetical protein
MAIRIKLTSGEEYLIQAELSEWDAAFRRAAAGNTMLEIELPDGNIRPIDPRAIKSFREEPEATIELEERLREVAPA